MIGYGPDISDENATRNQDDEDPDFHPLPPPITTKGTCCNMWSHLMTVVDVDGEMKEYVTTEDQNFIMEKRANQSQAATIHPSGLRLNPAKQPSVTITCVF